MTKQQRLSKAIDEVCIKYNVLNKSCGGSFDTLQLAMEKAIRQYILSLLPEEEVSSKYDNKDLYKYNDKKAIGWNACLQEMKKNLEGEI